MTDDYVFAPDLVAAAREFIRSESDGCVISIWQLLDELSDKFGDRFPLSPDTYVVLDLMQTLWTDPHVDQVPFRDAESIEFAWNEKGYYPDLDPALLGLEGDVAQSFRAGRREDR
jgi:hypothetical protein